MIAVFLGFIIRRGEGGWVNVGQERYRVSLQGLDGKQVRGTFRPRPVPFAHDRGNASPSRHRATIKALPSPHHPPSPLPNPGATSYIGANRATAKVALQAPSLLQTNYRSRSSQAFFSEPRMVLMVVPQTEH